jgi:hypothetical protein
MLIQLKKSKAQTTAEYAILIALIVGALLAMQIYVKRGLQGRVRDVVDHTGAGGEVGGETLEFSGAQYEPYYLTSQADTSQQTTEGENVQTGGAVGRTSTTTTKATREQAINPSEEE